MKPKLIDIVLIAILLGTVASGFAFSWQRTLGGGAALRMSADGRVICGVSSFGPASISTDAGLSWKSATNGPNGSSIFQGEVALSANGGKIYAIFSSANNRGIFKSSNYGLSWTRTSFPGTNAIYQHSPVACSADGLVVVTASGIGPIYYSTDGGATCQTSSVPNLNWQSIASSVNGQRMVAVASNDSVYLSADFGATWSPTNLPTEPWTSACISSDGQWIGAASETNSYISGDFGVTWLTNNIPGNDIACSADGTRWIIAGMQICTSTNSGKTWQTNFESTLPLNACAMSADGAEAFARVSGSGAWVGHDTPHPHLNIRCQGSIVALSWLLSSTNFMVQQKADFTTHWTTIPITPSLVLTNLQQEITLPATSGSAFFRLITE